MNHQEKSKLLIVDDSPTQLAKMEIILSRANYEVITAKNGVEGINMAYTELPDIIISDIIMPELSGYQLCRLLKNDQVTAHIPIILLTSLDQQQDKFWGMKAGADKYVLKDSDPAALLEKAQDLIEKSSSSISHFDNNKQPDNKKMAESTIKSRVNYILDKLLFESTIKNEIGMLANFIDDRVHLSEEFFNLLSSLITYSWAGIFLIARDNSELIIDINEPINEGELQKIEDLVIKDAKITDSKEKVNFCMLEDENIIKDDHDHDRIKSKYIYPLKSQNDYIGNISIFFTTVDAVSENIGVTMDIMSREFATVAKLMLLYEENKRLSITDELTNLYNRRYFEENLENEVDRALRDNGKLSIILLDIDFFKKFNDTYGHQMGDRVLKEVAGAFKKNLRKADFAARYGGEEFIIILPGIPIKGAETTAEKLRKEVAELRIPHKNGKFINVTISLGIAEFFREMHDVDTLIREADNALYMAKEAGRNRVFTSLPPA